MNICAIFDWDGVVIDSSELHRKSWELLALEEGLRLPEGHFEKGFGMKNQLIIPNILHWTTSYQEIERLSLRKEALYRELLNAEEVHPLPGVADFCALLRSIRVPCALASSTHRENIEVVLPRLSFGAIFETIVTGEDVVASKPDPAAFLLAAERMGFKPCECMVIEDAPAGIAGAHEAGMKVAAVATTRPPYSLTGADIVVRRLDELGRSKLENLFFHGSRAML